MVGYAYLSGETGDYNYIFIKAYNCDEHTPTQTLYPCEGYKVHRNTYSSELLFTDKANSGRYLRLSQITNICNKLKLAEHRQNYPLVISWFINPSGICEVKNISDMDLSWPYTPYCIERCLNYVNITDFFFNKTPCILYMTFLADVINDVAFYCGLSEGDYIKPIGSALFCSFELARVLYSCFNINIVPESIFNPVSKTSGNINKKYIIKNINQLKSTPGYSNNFNTSNLCKLKNNAVLNIAYLVKRYLSKKISKNDFFADIKTVFNESFESIHKQREDFKFYSGGMEYADMNYISYTELMGLYTFGNRKKEYLDIIKTNRKRYHTLKSKQAPSVIYENRLIYDYDK